MPSWLARQNSQKVPANALWLTNAMVQIFLIVTLFSKASYLALISLSTAMILLPYLFSAVYGLMLAWRGEGERSAQSASDTPVALIATVYCVWLLYAAGLKYLLLSSLLYAPGVVFYIWAKKQRAERPFTGIELGILALVMVLAIAAIALLATGRLTL
jgi:arginine:ornithine antiporter / lysine permease